MASQPTIQHSGCLMELWPAIHKILCPIVLPSFYCWSDVTILQHDNAMSFLGDKDVHMIQWPAVSSNLLLIEHLQNELGRRIWHQNNNLPPVSTSSSTGALSCKV